MIESSFVICCSKQKSKCGCNDIYFNAVCVPRCTQSIEFTPHGMDFLHHFYYWFIQAKQRTNASVSLAKIIFLCFDICNYICHDTSFFGFTFLNIFIFSSTLVLTFSYRRNLYTFYYIYWWRDACLVPNQVAKNLILLIHSGFKAILLMHTSMAKLRVL